MNIPSPAAAADRASAQPNPALASPAAASTRLVSLDALRGFDMFWILGGDAIMHALAAVVALVQFPVVKKIWTSSFVLVAGGWSLQLLAAFYYIIDVRRWRAWAIPFVWIGVNPITLYVLANLIRPRAVAQRIAGGGVKTTLDTYLGAGMGDLAIAVLGALIILLVARFLHRRQIFLRV